MDIRKLNLFKSDNNVVIATKPEDFAIGATEEALLPSVLENVGKLPYWSAQFQAWEPFLTTYLRSGVLSLASQYASKLADKIEDLGPMQGLYSGIYGEVVRSNRTTSVEVFADYSWDQIMQFVEWIPVIINNQKAINKIVYDPAVTRHYLFTMLNAEKDANGVSAYLAYAVYLYRHSVFENADELFKDLVGEMNYQLEVYASTFEREFNLVADFCNSKNNEVYGWYDSKICKIITNSWRTGCDKSGTRRVISNNDVFAMPVWLSEQITAYVNTLPSVCDLDVDYQFVFDAVQSALQGTAHPLDKSSYFAYCMPKSSLKKMYEILSDFYWEVKENRFVSGLIARVTAQYQEGVNSDVIDPISYKSELASRGFPVGEGD